MRERVANSEFFAVVGFASTALLGPTLVLLALTVGVAPLGFADDLPADGAELSPHHFEEWDEGPVRYLITPTESRIFRDLETPRERLSFIRNFWARRDANPITPVNETRVTFWQRVRHTNERFGTAKPGWKTDRGKIYILLGPPHDIEEDPNFDRQLKTVAGRGVLRWIYFGLRNAPVPAKTIVAFLKHGDEEWYLTDDPRFTSPFFHTLAEQAARASGLESPNSLQARTPGGLNALSRVAEDLARSGSELASAMDLGQLQEVPTEQDLMEEAIDAEDFVGNLRGALDVRQIHGPGTQPVVALTIAVPANELDPPWDGTALGLSRRLSASATFERVRDGTYEQVDVPEEAFVAEPTPSEDGRWLRLQALRALPEGDWNLSAVLIDRPGGGIAVLQDDLVVSPVSPYEPRINGPILAARLAVSATSVPSGREPFKMQEAIVTPAMDRDVPVGQPFSVFLEVLSPASVGDVPVGLRWRVERSEGPKGEGPFRPVGAEGSLEDARGPRAWEFEGQRFEPGIYRFTFVASALGTEITEVMSFRVFEP